MQCSLQSETYLSASAAAGAGPKQLSRPARPDVFAATISDSYWSRWESFQGLPDTSPSLLCRRPNATWRRTRGRPCQSWIQQIGDGTPYCDTASEPSGQELVIVGMAGRRNGPPLSMRYDDDDDDTSPSLWPVSHVNLWALAAAAAAAAAYYA